jgi:hypothetical protein
MSFDPKQFRELVVRPTLQYLDPEIPYSKEAEDLLCMTAAHESKLGTYLKQINGPAMGCYQMEPATHQDIHDNYLRHQPKIDQKVFDMVDGTSGTPLSVSVVYNLMYATAMARVHYYRVPEAIPKERDCAVSSDYLWALADYAKRHYNTYLGKAKSEDYYKSYLNYYGE